MHRGRRFCSAALPEFGAVAVRGIRIASVIAVMARSPADCTQAQAASAKADWAIDLVLIVAAADA